MTKENIREPIKIKGTFLEHIEKAAIYNDNYTGPEEPWDNPHDDPEEDIREENGTAPDPLKNK